MRKILYAIIAVTVVTLALLIAFKESDDNSYPLEYSELVAAASAEFSVPEDLIFAVIKCESNFDANARSNAGAVGLMQLMPATFDEVASRLKESPETDRINTPEYSIRYGSFYLSYLIRYFGDESTAVAAYNAGMGNVKSWLADSRYSSDGKTLDSIPYKETKNYVEKVTKAREQYKKILKGEQ